VVHALLNAIKSPREPLSEMRRAGGILALFGGPIEVWRLAGLPNPGEEARTYMENQEAPEAEGTTGSLA